MKNCMKIFYRFLKEKEAYRPFIINLKQQKYYPLYAIISVNEKLDRRCSPINSAFTWDNTEEGYDFWKKLHMECKEMFDKIKEDEYERIKENYPIF